MATSPPSKKARKTRSARSSTRCFRAVCRDARNSADDAQAAQRPHPQHHLYRRPHGLSSIGLLCRDRASDGGLVGALTTEVKPLGIKVTCVEPGPFRTDWAGRSLIQTPNRIEDYAETAGARMKTTSGYSGQQPGDPARAAEAMIRITKSRPAAPSAARAIRRRAGGEEDACGPGGDRAVAGAGAGDQLR